MESQAGDKALSPLPSSQGMLLTLPALFHKALKRMA